MPGLEYPQNALRHSKYSPEHENNDEGAVKVETHAATPGYDDVGIAVSMVIRVKREQENISDGIQHKECHPSELLISVMFGCMLAWWHRLGRERLRCLSQPEDWTAMRRKRITRLVFTNKTNLHSLVYSSPILLALGGGAFVAIANARSNL